ncbi:MAG TPA: deoxyribonuclease IV [Propionibacteriaceae bacterium]|nr:deoxyribonuclease IV [Propionibacteriaceae bacterium]
MIELGAHVDNTDPIAEAKARGAQLSQFFLGDPQGWKAPTVAYAAGADALRTDAQAAGIGLFVHGPYIVNVASTNNRVRIPSRKILQQQVDLAAQIGARGLIIHGGHVGSGDDVQVGFDNWRKAIDGTDLKLPVLIENTAGGAGAAARTLENIERLWQTIADAEGFENVGFCLDTCHAHAAGLELDGLVDKVMAITGRIDLVHANDSRDEFGSSADRHADLGTGFVDPDGLVQVIVEAQAPVIFETPGAKQGSTADVAWLVSRLG